MKINKLINIFIYSFFLSFFFLGCKGDENIVVEEELDELVISFRDIKEDSAVIFWNSPKSSEKIYYDILLEDKVISSEITDTSYSFENLKLDQAYSGKVIAKLESGKRIVGEFSFTTKTIAVDLEFKEFSIEPLWNSQGRIPLIYSHITWNKIIGPDGVKPLYRILVNGKTHRVKPSDSFETDDDKVYYGLPLGDYSFLYKVQIIAEFPENNDLKSEEIEIQSLSREEANSVFFESESIYIGYSTVVFKLSGLNLDTKNTVLLNGNIIYEDYKSNDLKIVLPVSYDNKLNTLKIVSRNESLNVEYNHYIDFTPLNLPPVRSNFDVKIFNVTHNSFRFVANSLKSNHDPIYLEDLNWDIWNLYINDEFIETTQCFRFFQTPFSYELTPNTNYIIKIENARGQDEVVPPNPIYEPDLIIERGFKEFEITTYPIEVTPSSNIDVYTSNITSNSFDLYWLTALSYNCGYHLDTGIYYGVNYIYEFTLKLNGIEYMKFNPSKTSPKILIEGLDTNTEYNVELILSRDNRIFRETNFKISTL
ncbi:hypothetical protein [Tenacibaculum sp. M341]|uniref:hypothetical protein n=1 Tax=Tenacibaculum sp. M341 TaxID=2530339 RepID=UPI00104A7330|nr:hypothetical protein [Tenacibaculum sp. M341]TCI84572.1 hypothetical protein EYW44_20610 [Tenacibaculum sp. M341]